MRGKCLTHHQKHQKTSLLNKTNIGQGKPKRCEYQLRLSLTLNQLFVGLIALTTQKKVSSSLWRSPNNLANKIKLPPRPWTSLSGGSAPKHLQSNLGAFMKITDCPVTGNENNFSTNKPKNKVLIECACCKKSFYRAHTEHFKQVQKGQAAFYCSNRCKPQNRQISAPLELYAKLGIDIQKRHLGRLCKQKHDFENTGYSLRGKGNQCLICSKENAAKKRKTSEYKAKSKARCSTKEYRQKNNEYMREYRKTEYSKEYCRKYRKTEIGKAAKERRRQRRRALLKRVHSANWTSQQWIDLCLFFDNQCAYCPNTSEIEPDHFIPISRGGSNCLGNIVPCCKRCNTSKRNLDPDKWYKQQTFFCKERWKKILKHLNVSLGESFTQIPLF